MLKKSSTKKKVKRHTYNLFSRNLVLIVGHDKRNMGAYSPTLGKFEYELNDELAKSIADHCRQKNNININVVHRNKGLQAAYLQALSYDPGAIIELHFNAFNGSASGSEVLFNDKKDEPGIQERLFSAILLNETCKALGTKTRGLKVRASRGERGFHNLSKVSSVPSVILEPFFGDSHDDCERFQEGRTKLIKAVVSAFLEYRSEMMYKD